MTYYYENNSSVEHNEQKGQTDISIEVPGFKKEEISIFFENGEDGNSVLYVKGENAKRKLNKVFSISSHYDQNKTEASIDLGILKISLKPSEHYRKQYKVEIK